MVLKLFAFLAMISFPFITFYASLIFVFFFFAEESNSLRFQGAFSKNNETTLVRQRCEDSLMAT